MYSYSYVHPYFNIMQCTFKLIQIMCVTLHIKILRTPPIRMENKNSMWLAIFVDHWQLLLSPVLLKPYFIVRIYMYIFKTSHPSGYASGRHWLVVEN